MQKETVVFKFGGGCFKDIDSFNHSLQIVEKYRHTRLVIVCSALNGITNKLIEFGKAVYASTDPACDPKVADTLKFIIDKHDATIDQTFSGNEAYIKSLKSYVREQIERLKAGIKEIQTLGFAEKTFDFVVHFGERMSTYLFQKFLEYKNIPSEYISSDKEFLITNANFTNALPKLDLCEEKISKRLNPILDHGKVAVVTGYYGSAEKGEITTLGRGGTDFSATIVAYSLKKSDEDFVTVIFWKDVDGILAANPKVVKDAKILSKLSYREARELAFFGSNILHPLCLITAEKKCIKTEIRNFEHPERQVYTEIVACFDIPPNGHVIKAISSMNQIALVTVEGDAMVSLPGAAANLFQLMGDNNININFISQSSSENNITFGTSVENAEKVKVILSNSKFFKKQWFSINVNADMGIIAVVGMGMLQRKGIAGRVFTLLGENDVNIVAIAQGSSEMNITMVIHKNDVEKAVNVLYNEFIR